MKKEYDRNSEKLAKANLKVIADSKNLQAQI
jgi:hypothetical protein